MISVGACHEQDRDTKDTRIKNEVKGPTMTFWSQLWHLDVIDLMYWHNVIMVQIGP